MSRRQSHELLTRNRFEGESEAIKAEDDVLVELARSGDTDSFARLMDLYSGFCRRRAYLILRNHHDAEDEVQNTWIQVWRHLESYQGRGAFRGWLFRIILNRCLMRLRRERLTTVISIDEARERDGYGSYRPDLIDPRDLPEDVVGRDEVLGVLMREIRGVPPSLRKVLVMRDLSDLTLGEIAGQLGTTRTAVKSRLMRARVELRRRLGKHHGARGAQTLTQKAPRGRMGFSRVS
jgi:RNA polymerase sigma-70 factor, ECF subfamily